MDIVGLILQAAIEGATKAKIMDLVHLSILQAKDYLFVLLENGLLCYGKGTGIYKTTEKGLRMLENYNLVSEHMGPEYGVNTLTLTRSHEHRYYAESDLIASQKNIYEIKNLGNV